MVILQNTNNGLSVTSKLVVFLFFLILSVSEISLAKATTVQDFDLDQRVACQTTIEDIRWSHHIWPTENFTTKPARSKILSDQQIREKVENILRMEAALAGIYKVDITTDMLQAELNRMASSTKAPQRLQEFFDALENEPVALAQCLARPELVQKLLYNNYSWDTNYHGDLRAQAEEALTHTGDPTYQAESGALKNLMVLQRTDKNTEPEADGLSETEDEDSRKVVELQDDEFEEEVARLTEQPGTIVRETETAFVYQQVLSQTANQLKVQNLVWKKTSFHDWWQFESSDWQATDVTRTQQFVGAGPLALPVVNNKFDVHTLGAITGDTWAPTPTIPIGRHEHTTIWTGSEMIVWGGYNTDYRFLNSGGRYDPATDSWTAITTTGAPTGRDQHTAIWTGTEMIVWGGYNSSSLDTGGRYDPVTDHWATITSTGAPGERWDHSAIWTGSEMIVWGGRIFGSAISLDNGGRYDPVTDNWIAITTSGAPTGRREHTAIWTNSEMIVWGGHIWDHGAVYLNSGGRYNPATDSWTFLNTTGAPDGREGYTAIWTGNEMIVWGGSDGWYTYFNSGGRYNLTTDTWTVTTITGAPTGRNLHTAIWTGSEMVIWGGSGSEGWDSYFDNGGRYDPSTDTWTVTTTTGAPAERDQHTAVWTGTEMIIWGGVYDYNSYLNTGGRYDPATDSWTPTQSAGAPIQRTGNTTIWTGIEMIIWGGSNLNTGSRYNPALDSWIPINTIGAPSVRTGHTAIWTGKEMIIWGGLAGEYENLNTGSRYDPALDSWIPITANNAPIERTGHTAIWTGKEMIVWGGISETDYIPPYHRSGGRYNPTSDTWVAVNTTNTPYGCYGHTTIWTGREMIIWGGEYRDPEYSVSHLEGGGRYDPATDIWTAVTTSGEPNWRSNHTAIWTGREMIIWGGGYDYTSYLNTGSRYDSVTDSWTTTTSSGAPGARQNHTAIWTGSEMIVWGGRYDITSYLNTGGRYDPITDSWTTTTSSGAPSERVGHTAIWTGREMIIWGGSSSDNSLGIYYPYSTYSVGGSVTGLTEGDSIVLQINGGNDQLINGDGDFTFVDAVLDRSYYYISVRIQPATPDQACISFKGFGKIFGADVNNVQIICGDKKFPWHMFRPAFLGDSRQ